MNNVHANLYDYCNNFTNLHIFNLTVVGDFFFFLIDDVGDFGT